MGDQPNEGTQVNVGEGSEVRVGGDANAEEQRRQEGAESLGGNDGGENASEREGQASGPESSPPPGEARERV